MQRPYFKELRVKRSRLWHPDGRAEYKDLEREGREGCGTQTGWVNFEEKKNSFASRREGLRVRMRERCDADIGGANSERKSSLGAARLGKARNAA